MSDWIPLYISLLIIMLIGVFVPYMISGFIDVSEPNPDSYVNSIITLVQNGFSIDLFFIWNLGINPFSWFGASFQNAIILYLNAFSYIPSAISAPLLILVIVGFTWTFLKLIPFI